MTQQQIGTDGLTEDERNSHSVIIIPLSEDSALFHAHCISDSWTISVPFEELTIQLRQHYRDEGLFGRVIKGECPYCHQVLVLTEGGLIPAHKATPDAKGYCRGWGAIP